MEGEEIQMEDLIRNWWHDPNSFKVIGDKIYHVPWLRNPSKMTNLMLCHLYGEKDNSKLKLSCVLLIHQVLKKEYLIGITSSLLTSRKRFKNLKNHLQGIALDYLCMVI